MPQSLQNKIKKAIEKKPRFHKGIFEKRAMINGVEVYGGARELADCEASFLNDLTQKMHLLGDDSGIAQLKSSMRFQEIAQTWLHEVYKPSVSADTFYREMSRYRKHILPAFGKKKLSEIRPLDCTQFFNALNAKNMERTAEGAYSLLNRTLQFAVDNGALDRNPMRTIKLEKHERENGIPLTLEEETALLQAIRGVMYEPVLILALYTGLRPCEYKTARLEGNFVIAQNCKQKTKKIVYKKIPVTPMLRPHLEPIKAAMQNWEYLCRRQAPIYRAFKRILPDHKLYDLRTTFATRCQECGVSEQVVQCFMGHSPKTLLGKVYTKFDDSFLYKEGEKVKY